LTFTDCPESMVVVTYNRWSGGDFWWGDRPG
jgi:hypothetical protein